MANRSAASPRISRSPSPAGKPTSQLQEKADIGPLGLSWAAYRWVVRALMALCLSQCVVVYVFCHDLPYAIAKAQLVEEIAVGFAILVCMSKTWHRKRLSRYFLWTFLLLLIYLLFATSNARRFYSYHQVEQEKLAIQAQKAQKELEQLLRQVQYTQKEQADLIEIHDYRIERVLRFINAQIDQEKDTQMQKYVTDASSIAWSLFKNYVNLH